MKLLQTLVFAVLVSPFAAGAQVVSGWETAGKVLHTDAAVHNFEVEVDSVDFRPDLTRVYGRFIGTPHVGINVKQVVLTTDTGRHLVATDTDGFDLNKYFQFEETPAFDVEMDFEPTTPAGDITLMFITANGIISYQYSSPPRKN